MTMPATGTPQRRADVQAARTVCRNCPVFVDCRYWVLSTAPDPCPEMMVAGLTPEERKVARRAFYAAADERAVG